MKTIMRKEKGRNACLLKESKIKTRRNVKCLACGWKFYKRGRPLVEGSRCSKCGSRYVEPMDETFIYENEEARLKMIESASNKMKRRILLHLIIDTGCNYCYYEYRRKKVLIHGVSYCPHCASKDIYGYNFLDDAKDLYEYNFLEDTKND